MCEKETEKPLSQLASFRFLRKPTYFPRKTYAFNCNLCFESREQNGRNQHFLRKTYAFNFLYFCIFNREQKNPEAMLLIYPKDVTKSAKALVSFVCLNPFGEKKQKQKNPNILKVCSRKGKGKFYSLAPCSRGIRMF